MNEHDNQLIEDAKNIHYDDWYLINNLIKQTANLECIKQLRWIRSLKGGTEKRQDDR